MPKHAPFLAGLKNFFNRFNFSTSKKRDWHTFQTSRLGFKDGTNSCYNLCVHLSPIDKIRAGLLE